ncbi:MULTISPECIES: glycosyltransferase [Pseudoclavibacter]|uniref:glycosyltransferase n=1 Tax=Pseudoclavibacter TaxID=255204 RepID=UPI0015CB547B|nr:MULTISPECIES: glycosyltransferase [Pseudoclavibacter]NYF12758.1 glycosyltransferase involved in cell wall biosynthesis [Pseudoclavibacter sp. JAI123]
MVPASHTKICSITPVLPHARVQHAGGLYVWQLDAALVDDLGAELHYLVPDLPSNSAAAEDPSHARSFDLLARARGRRHSLAVRVYNAVRRIDPDAPYLPAVLDLWFSRRLRAAIQNAEVLDFQWSSWARLIGLRRLNPGAITVVTLHDVSSQRGLRERERATSRLQRWKWDLAHRIARSSEKHLLRVADHIVVFSEKDRSLLDPQAAHTHIRVIPPPLAAGHSAQAKVSRQPTVLFLGFFARAENRDGLLWFVERCWPAIQDAVPGARLRVAGGGMSDELRAHLENVTNVDLLGFVDDLDDVYQDTSVAVIPLLSGAGVKFKTVEPIVRGIPVVATSVGAEGVGEPSWYAGVADDAREFSAAVTDTLLHPEIAFERAAGAREDAMTIFGREAFLNQLRNVYLRGEPNSEGLPHGI